MEIKSEWQEIRKHFTQCFKSNYFVSIASVDEENMPTVTPIGSLFLNHNQTGFYFEKFPTKLALSSKLNQNICVLAVNSNIWFWFIALLKGKFNSYPAVRLYGRIGEKRKATKIEIQRLKLRMRLTRGLRGNNYLWDDMQVVREIIFTKAEKINLGKMTQDL